jgi:hypothetical protein
MKRHVHALASGHRRRQEVPQVSPEILVVRATMRGSFATDQVVLNTAPTTLNQRVTPSGARRRHSDGDRTVRPQTQSMHGNRVPVHGVAVSELAGEDTEEGERNSSARVQER